MNTATEFLTDPTSWLRQRGVPWVIASTAGGKLGGALSVIEELMGECARLQAENEALRWALQDVTTRELRAQALALGVHAVKVTE